MADPPPVPEVGLDEQTPDRSTLSKMRRLVNLGIRKAAFRCELKRMVAEGLLSGKSRTGVDRDGWTYGAGAVAHVSEAGVEQVVADKGDHSGELVRALAEVGVRTVVAEPEPRRLRWAGQSARQAAAYADRRRLEAQTAKARMKRRGIPPRRRPMTSPTGRDASSSLAEMGLCQQVSKSLQKRQLEHFIAPSGDAATTSDDAATESGKDASEFWQVMVARLLIR